MRDFENSSSTTRDFSKEWIFCQRNQTIQRKQICCGADAGDIAPNGRLIRFIENLITTKDRSIE
jgi:hypothetical protein